MFSTEFVSAICPIQNRVASKWDPDCGVPFNFSREEKRERERTRQTEKEKEKAATTHRETNKFGSVWPIVLLYMHFQSDIVDLRFMHTHTQTHKQ